MKKHPASAIDLPDEHGRGAHDPWGGTLPPDTSGFVRPAHAPASHPWWCDRRTCLRVRENPTSAYTRHDRHGAFMRLSVMKYDDEPGVVDVDFTSACFDHWTDALSLTLESLTMGLLLLVLRRPGANLIGATR